MTFKYDENVLRVIYHAKFNAKKRPQPVKGKVFVRLEDLIHGIKEVKYSQSSAKEKCFKMLMKHLNLSREQAIEYMKKALQ